MEMKKGITLIETLIAVLTLGFMLIPIFGYLSGAVQDTEKIYTNSIALTRASFIMDAMMFQIPFRTIRQNQGNGNSCRFNSERTVNINVNFNGNTREEAREELRKKSRENLAKESQQLLEALIPEMFGKDGNNPKISSTEWCGEGTYMDAKGYYYYSIAKVLDVNDTGNPGGTPAQLPNMFGGDSVYKFDDYATIGDDGKKNLMKKIMVQVIWVNKKGVKQPQNQSKYNSIHLIGYKSDLD